RATGYKAASTRWQSNGRHAPEKQNNPYVNAALHRRLRCFGAFAEKVATGLSLRHDHGSQYMSDDFQAEIRFLGIESSPAFVRAPEGNGCAERFIRTLKESLLWVRPFATVEDLRQALLEFRDLYNETWLLERHGFMSPNAVRARALSNAAIAA
ncbi:integrase core domain-containing protein, partial [Gluconacetobacter sacchari]|uniref:integrase core domain-containing protein n=2 Tax=Gluconacetobacter sacchari TaxID=92759 RepID=UPI001FE900CB